MAIGELTGVPSLLVVAALCCSACAGPSSAPETDSASAGAALTTESGAGPDQAGWCHRVLRAADGTRLDFDYLPVGGKVNGPGGGAFESFSDPAWVNVSRDGLRGTEQVNVVVVDYAYSAKFHFEGAYEEQGTQMVQLTWDPAVRRFTARLPNKLPMWRYISGQTDATLHMFELAVQIDGAWLTDPVNGSHNFRYIPHDQSQGACKGLVY